MVDIESPALEEPKLSFLAQQSILRRPLLWSNTLPDVFLCPQPVITATVTLWELFPPSTPGLRIGLLLTQRVCACNGWWVMIFTCWHTFSLVDTGCYLTLEMWNLSSHSLFKAFFAQALVIPEIYVRGFRYGCKSHILSVVLVLFPEAEGMCEGLAEMMAKWCGPHRDPWTWLCLISFSFSFHPIN